MNEKTEWVDFKEIKEKVSMEDILGHYKLLKGLKRKGNELKGFCPFTTRNTTIRGRFVRIRRKITGIASRAGLVATSWTLPLPWKE